MLDAKPAPILEMLSAKLGPPAVRIELSPVEASCGSVVRDLRLISRGRERQEQRNKKCEGTKHYAEDNTIRHRLRTRLSQCLPIDKYRITLGALLCILSDGV